MVRLAQNHRAGIHKQHPPQLAGFFEPLRPEWFHNESGLAQAICAERWIARRVSRVTGVRPSSSK